MMRAATVLVVLTLVSCDARTDRERGAEMFRPAAEKLGVAQAADLKAKADKAYQQYLTETQSKDEGELGRKLARMHLDRYAPVLALTPSEEREFKAGKFNDVERRKKFNELANRYAAGSTSVVGLLLLAKSQAGAEWTSGLQLELAIRILAGDLGVSPR